MGKARFQNEYEYENENGKMSIQQRGRSSHKIPSILYYLII